jgi:CheY-like chemotaxis protein
VLTKALSADGHTTLTGEHGLHPLERLGPDEEPGMDVVLLDLEMPEFDGYETLARIKPDARLRHLPVIVISSVDALDSVVRCIRIGATDYLPKPFNAELLRARLNSSLAEKRLHDLQLEYPEEVGHVVDAAAAVEAEVFEPASLDGTTRSERRPRARVCARGRTGDAGRPGVSPPRRRVREPADARGARGSAHRQRTLRFLAGERPARGEAAFPFPDAEVEVEVEVALKASETQRHSRS